jgi:hypothetical protein
MAWTRNKTFCRRYINWCALNYEEITLFDIFSDPLCRSIVYDWMEDTPKIQIDTHLPNMGKKESLAVLDMAKLELDPSAIVDVLRKIDNWMDARSEREIAMRAQLVMEAYFVTNSPIYLDLDDARKLFEGENYSKQLRAAHGEMESLIAAHDDEDGSSTGSSTESSEYDEHYMHALCDKRLFGFARNTLLNIIQNFFFPQFLRDRRHELGVSAFKHRQVRWLVHKADIENTRQDLSSDVMTSTIVPMEQTEAILIDVEESE